MLSISGLDKTFLKATIDELCLFEDFNLEVPDGQFISIIGSNGSGKSTLLNLICGTVKPDAGEIVLDGEHIERQTESRRAKRIGRVFQDPAKGSSGDLTLLENLALADNKHGHYNLRPGVNRRRIPYYIEQLQQLDMGLEHRLDQTVKTLSGGQRQALAMLMATFAPIDLLILDEHTAALDPKNSSLIMEYTNRLVQEKQLTTIMVTHNLRDALKYGDRLLMFHQGEIILDRQGKDKENSDLDDVLDLFNTISIEVGNSV